MQERASRKSRETVVSAFLRIIFAEKGATIFENKEGRENNQAESDEVVPAEDSPRYRVEKMPNTVREMTS